MFVERKVHVPQKYHDRIKLAVTQDDALAVRLDLVTPGEDIMLLTPGQMIKIDRAIKNGKKVMTIKLSRKQVKANVKHEGVFLGTILSLATKFLPQLLGSLASGAISGAVDKAVSGRGSGLFLGKRGYGTARITFNDGNGLTLTPVEDEKCDGVYLKHDGQVYQGKGLLLGPNSPFKNIPLLNLIL